MHIRSRLRLRSLATTVTLVVATVMGAAAPNSAAGSTVSASAAGGDGTALKRHVTIGALPAAPIVKEPVQMPAVEHAPPRPTGPSTGRPPAVIGRSAPKASRPGSPKTPQSAPGALEQLTTFDGIGNTGFTPPDTQAAVGPGKVVEFVNASGRITTKSGTQLSTFGLNTFFGAPTIVMNQPTYSDPRVVYDALSGRFFASILIFDRCDNRPPPVGSGCTTNNDSEVDIAVSDSSDPSAGWSVYTEETDTSNVLFDQPKLGLSSDKAVMTYNENGFSGPYRFVELQKSDLLAAAASVATTRFALDSGHFNVIPVASMSATNTEFAVSANQNSSTLTLFAFTGTPAGGDAAFTTQDFSIGTYSSPPGVTQPNDSRTLDSGVPAVQSAVWDRGVLWAAGNDSCTPGGDSTARACLRMDRLTTSGDTGTLTQDIDLGQTGAYLFYPAVMTDLAGNLFIGHSVASSTEFGTAGMTFAPSGTLPSTVPGIDYKSGVGPYDCTFCFDNSTTPPTPLDNRWGDYSAAVRDPADPYDVWFGEEFGSSSTTNTDAWGTELGRFTQAPPTVTGVSPATAPEQSSDCAPAVTVTGTDFVAGQTGVLFGSTPAASVNVTAPDTLIAIAPAQARGTVDVTVTTPAGTSDTSAADGFTYLADTIAPTATAAVSPAPNGLGWNHASPVTVTLTAADQACGSGVQKITYSETGAQTSAATDVAGATANVPVTTDGTTTITYTATDNAGNTSAPQSVVVKLDTVAPSITVTSPTAGSYLLNQNVAAAYGCTDATSGVATCTGPVPNGAPIDTTAVGGHAFTVTATDNADNPASTTVNYQVAYKICLNYDPTKPHNTHSTVPIKVAICDANNTNLSNAGTTLTLVGVARASDHVVIHPLSGTFTFQGPPGYEDDLVLNGLGLANGNYELQFTVSGADTSVHSAPFIVG